MAHSLLKVIPASKKYLNGDINLWLDGLRMRIEKETGPPDWKMKINEKIAPFLLWYTDFKLRRNIGQQPAFKRSTYRM